MALKRDGNKTSLARSCNTALNASSYYLRQLIVGISTKTTTHTALILSQYLPYTPGCCTSPFSSPPLRVLAATNQNNFRLMSLLSTRIAACLFSYNNSHQMSTCLLCCLSPHDLHVVTPQSSTGLQTYKMWPYATTQAIAFQIFL